MFEPGPHDGDFLFAVAAGVAIALPADREALVGEADDEDNQGEEGKELNEDLEGRFSHGATTWEPGTIRPG